MSRRAAALLIVVFAALAPASAARADARIAHVRSALPSGRTAYRTSADYTDDLHALVRDHPSLVRLIKLTPRTARGRTIEGVEIARRVHARNDGRPTYLILGGTHAREWSSAEIPMEFAEDLVKRDGAGEKRVKALLTDERVVVIPVVNPDGFAASRSGLDDLRRKNCNGDANGAPLTPPACVRNGGVDPNRNAGPYWGGDGASTNPSSSLYRGAGPWSEAETEAVHAFSQQHQIMVVESMHNFAALVLRQPGFSEFGTTPDDPAMKRLGDAEGAAAGYPSETDADLYNATGGLEDWNYLEQGAYAYTIEIDSPDQDFHSSDYEGEVVDQYLGTPGTSAAGRGLRQALLLGAGSAADPAQHATLTGNAAPGDVLRVQKAFSTPTSPVCAATDSDGDCVGPLGPRRYIPDGIDTTMTVPASGHFTWAVGPSRNPDPLAQGQTTTWTFSCETPAGAVLASVPLAIGRNRTATFAGACTAGAPPPVVKTTAR